MYPTHLNTSESSLSVMYWRSDLQFLHFYIARLSPRPDSELAKNLTLSINIVCMLYMLSRNFHFLFWLVQRMLCTSLSFLLSSQTLLHTLLQTICKNIFACLFSIHNTISLSRNKQVCLMRLRFMRYSKIILPTLWLWNGSHN